MEQLQPERWAKNQKTDGEGCDRGDEDHGGGRDPWRLWPRGESWETRRNCLKVLQEK